MGKDSMPTNNGIYILGDHNDNMIMDSNTYGLSSNSAEGYVTPVDYATQMSYSGIYLHLSLIHISEPTRLSLVSRMPSSA